MNNLAVLSIFLPHNIVNKLSRRCFVFGYREDFQNSILVNCLFFVERRSEYCEENFLSDFLSDTKHRIRLLGIIYCAEETKNIRDAVNCNSILFILKVNKVTDVFKFERFASKITCGRVIIYDAASIMKAQLLPIRQNFNSEGVNFISFLVQTLNTFCSYSGNDIEKKFGIESQLMSLKCTDEENFSNILPSSSSLIILLLIRFYCSVLYLIIRPSSWVNDIFLLTTIGQQFYQRLRHCTCILNESVKKKLSLKEKNLICAITVDIIVGFLLSYILLQSKIPDVMLDIVISKTNEIVSGLQNLISWLMGVPAGLKLNIPLNSALGKFFLYHIYLWESYMMVVQPVFAFILKISTVIGIFGLTFFISLLNDLISLATIHIYCFYGYATRLYGYQVNSLSALWRLFRGKKWNPLRQRLDSYTYDVYQLYLGTLLFTVLLFLLPTVMVYYIVFVCLRILVLFVQGIITRVINMLSVLPIYSITLRLMDSYETAGDVYFTVLNAEEDLVLSMQASQLPLKTVIDKTLPNLNQYNEILTWKEFLLSIFWGKIVYPL